MNQLSTVHCVLWMVPYMSYLLIKCTIFLNTILHWGIDFETETTTHSKHDDDEDDYDDSVHKFMEYEIK